MKKYVFYVIFSFIMMFSFSNNVFAKTEKGYCQYSSQKSHKDVKDYIKIIIYDDNSITFKQSSAPEGGLSSLDVSVSDNQKNNIINKFNNGECYQIFSLTIEKGSTLLDFAKKYINIYLDTFVVNSDAEYKLFKKNVPSAPLRCNYSASNSDGTKGFKADVAFYSGVANGTKVSLTYYRYKDLYVNGESFYADNTNANITIGYQEYDVVKICPTFMSIRPTGGFDFEVGFSNMKPSDDDLKVYNGMLYASKNSSDFYDEDGDGEFETEVKPPDTDEFKMDNTKLLSDIKSLTKDLKTVLSDFDYDKCKDTSLASPYSACISTLKQIEENYRLKYWEQKKNIELINPSDFTDSEIEQLKSYEALLDEAYNTDFNNAGANILNILENVISGRATSPYDKDIIGREVTTCEGLIGENTLELLKGFRNIIMTAGPILAVVLGTYDLVVAMASGEEDAKKKGIKKMKGRMIAAVLLLTIPYILNFILNVVNGFSKSCV